MNKTTLKDIFEKTFNNDKHKVVYEYYHKGKIEEVTYEQFKDKIQGIFFKLENYLKEIPEESWVILQASSHPWNMAIIWAILKKHMNVLLLDDKSTCVEQVIKNSNAKVIITENEYFGEKILNIKLDALRECVPIKYESSKGDFADKIALCTSGTSGDPKIFVHTGKQIFAHIHNVIERYKQIDDLKYNTVKKNTKKTMFLFKFHHIGSLFLSFMYPYIGGTLVYTDTIGIKILLELINEREIQNVYAVPMIWDSMISYIEGKFGDTEPETIKRVFGSKLRLALMGAAKATESTVKILNSAEIFTTSAYGMTEIGSLTSNIDKNIETRNSGIVGKVESEFYDVKIKRLDGAIESDGEGELLVRGDVVYYSQLKNGLEVVRDKTKENFFHTGDFVSIKNNELKILGRIKDVIVNSSGENIYIEQLESCFEEIKSNKLEYTIIGVNDNPVIVIHMKDRNVDEQIIGRILEINSKLEIYKRIKGVYISSKALDRTSTGKIKRNEIIKKIENNDSSVKEIFI